MTQYKYFLDEKDMPTHWYNILADMKKPPPFYLHPATLEVMEDPPMPPPVFPMELIKQEFSKEQFIEIPDEVQDVLLADLHLIGLGFRQHQFQAFLLIEHRSGEEENQQQEDDIAHRGHGYLRMYSMSRFFKHLISLL